MKVVLFAEGFLQKVFSSIHFPYEKEGMWEGEKIKEDFIQ